MAFGEITTTTRAGTIATGRDFGEVEGSKTCYHFFIVNITVTESKNGAWHINDGLLSLLGRVGLRTSGHVSNFCKCMPASDYLKIKTKLLLEGITEGIKTTTKGDVTYYSGIEIEKLYKPCDYYTQCRCYRNTHLRGRDNKLLHSGSGCWVTATGDCREMSGSANDVMQDIINTERQNTCDCS